MVQANRLPTDDARLLSREHDELPGELILELVIRDPDTIAELCARPEGYLRDEFALSALRIGILALKQAGSRVDGDLIARETDRMLQSLEGQLKEHAFKVQKDIADALREYFDPETGRVPERIARLIRKDGELEQVLRRQVGAVDSEMCKTLAMHFGQDSPLLKLLSPQESTGVLAALRTTLEEQLAQQREHVLREFSLDNKEGALSRLVAQLTEHHGKLTEEIDDKVDDLVTQFSLDDENSALSRLKAMLVETNKAIQSHLTLDDEASALARLKRELLSLLEAQQRQSSLFQEEVKLTLAKLVTRREEAARTTTHGRDFEEAVIQFVTHETQKAGDLATPTGSSVGLIRACKTGDCVIELGPDCIAPGAKVVVEAKEDRSYSLADARAEIEQARKNRGAEVGLFVFSKKTAPPALARLARIGCDVFVAWDADDPQTDLFLEVGLTLAKALCVRAGRERETQRADFESIDRAILEIEKQSDMLGQIETSATTIRKSSDTILERVRIARDSVARQIRILREKTSDLKQTFSESGGTGEQ
jgi:hypothetical protein